MSGSAPTQREIIPRMTTESSTTITRSGSCCRELATAELVNATLITHQLKLRAVLFGRSCGQARRLPHQSDQPDFLELGGDNVLVERLHDVFVGAGVKGARDVRDIVFRRAENHLGLVATGHPAEIAKEFIAIHDRHVPIEQDGFGQSALADLKRLLAVLGFDNLEIKAFQDTPCDLSDDA